jgi:glucokinase
MKALSLDIGGSHIACGVVDDSKLLAQASIPSAGAHSLAAVLPAVTETLGKLLLEAATEAQDCAGVAISFPGVVDARTGSILSTLKKYDDAPELDLSSWSRDAFGLPTRIESDARMALFGERYAGAAAHVDNVVMMTLGTGIGTAAIMNGHMLRGIHAHAGCLGGHFSVDIRGSRCLCGNIGCAESEASGRSMPAVARRFLHFEKSSLASLTHLGFSELFAHADHGDAVAIDVRNHCLDVWGASVVDLIHAYDPEIVIIGGGVMQSAHIIVPHVQEYVNEHTWTSWGKPRVYSAQLGNLAAIMGAVPLLTENLTPEIQFQERL